MQDLGGETSEWTSEVGTGGAPTPDAGPAKFTTPSGFWKVGEYCSKFGDKPTCAKPGGLPMASTAVIQARSRKEKGARQDPLRPIAFSMALAERGPRNEVIESSSI